jgi:hypothetical protein
MASKKKKDDKSTADKGSLLPKSIAGVKVPKGVRSKLADLAKHQIVADIISAGLVALAARLKNDPKAGQAATTAADTAKEAVETLVGSAAEALTTDTAAKPVAKRTRKAPAAEPKADTGSATPVARRPRKPAAASPTPAPAATPRTRKAAAAPESAAKPPARRTRKAADSAAAKPRAARRPAPKQPSPPKAPE